MLQIYNKFVVLQNIMDEKCFLSEVDNLSYYISVFLRNHSLSASSSRSGISSVATL